MLLFSRPKSRLAGEKGVQHVSLRARVASSNDQTSPLTGMQAALLHVTVATRLSINSSGNDAAATLVREVGSVLLGASIDLIADIDGTRIRVLSRDLVVKPAADMRAASMLAKPIAEIAELVARANEANGVVCVRETALRTEDAVLLVAHVAEEGAVIASGYRSEAGVVWVTQSNAGPVVLTEIIESPSW